MSSTDSTGSKTPAVGDSSCSHDCFGSAMTCARSSSANSALSSDSKFDLVAREAVRCHSCGIAPCSAAGAAPWEPLIH